MEKHTLAECIKYCPDNQKQLILTHTNAGIASINEKLRELEIDSSKCHINTICGFAQSMCCLFVITAIYHHKKTSNILKQLLRKQ